MLHQTFVLPDVSSRRGRDGEAGVCGGWKSGRGRIPVLWHEHRRTCYTREFRASRVCGALCTSDRLNGTRLRGTRARAGVGARSRQASAQRRHQQLKLSKDARCLGIFDRTWPRKRLSRLQVGLLGVLRTLHQSRGLETSGAPGIVVGTWLNGRFCHKQLLTPQRAAVILPLSHVCWSTISGFSGWPAPFTWRGGEISDSSSRVKVKFVWSYLTVEAEAARKAGTGGEGRTHYRRCAPPSLLRICRCMRSSCKQGRTQRTWTAT